MKSYLPYTLRALLALGAVMALQACNWFKTSSRQEVSLEDQVYAYKGAYLHVTPSTNYDYVPRTSSLGIDYIAETQVTEEGDTVVSFRNLNEPEAAVDSSIAQAKVDSLPVDTTPAPGAVGTYDHATTALNTDQFYASIQAGYEVREEDTQEMRQFKSLKDSLDTVLREQGYTEKEIKQFYVLNYLGQGQGSSRSGSNNHLPTSPYPAMQQLWLGVVPDASYVALEPRAQGALG